MRLWYLGTSASEGVPDPFCRCVICENARRKGGRNIRTRAQALLDGKILLDFGPDTFLHTLRYSLNLDEIDAVLITHPHFDHLNADDLAYFPYCAHGDNRPPEVYAGADAVELIRSRSVPLEKIALHTVRAFVPFEAAGYRVTPLAADHSPRDSLVYAVEHGGKSLLYLHDTGILPDETWAYLRETDICFDLVSYDCTGGLLPWNNRAHMTLEGDTQVRRRLAEMGRVSSATVHVISHFSHNGSEGYDEMLPFAKERGFTVAYDGLTVDF